MHALPHFTWPRISRVSQEFSESVHPPAAQQARQRDKTEGYSTSSSSSSCYFCCPECARVLIIALREEEFYFTHAMHSGMPSLCLRPPPRMSLNCINNALATLSRKGNAAKALLLTCVCANNQIFYCPVYYTCRIALCLFNLSALMRFASSRQSLSTLLAFTCHYYKYLLTTILSKNCLNFVRAITESSTKYLQFNTLFFNTIFTQNAYCTLFWLFFSTQKTKGLRLIC
jgi:hypothetical protein